MNERMLSNGTMVIEFESLSAFYNYITKTKVNNTFTGINLQSETGSKEFTGTESFEEAVNLMKNGWHTMAETLTKRLTAIENEIKPAVKQRNILSVQGYQAIVPLYLNGSPNNMIGKKSVPVKQKVITINKSIDYAGSTTAQTIIEESVKALQIVKKLEAQGQRINLNIVLGSSTGSFKFFIKVKIKNSTERLNVSKLAFPLANPSMLRRLFFKFVEVYPQITRDFSYGHGTPAEMYKIKEIFKDEYLIPNFLKTKVDEIKTIKDLK